MYLNNGNVGRWQGSFYAMRGWTGQQKNAEDKEKMIYWYQSIIPDLQI